MLIFHFNRRTRKVTTLHVFPSTECFVKTLLSFVNKIKKIY